MSACLANRWTGPRPVGSRWISIPLLAVAFVALSAGSLPAMDFVFLAFGDSITRANACPVDCDTEFDEQGLGGYVGRLDSRLGAGYRVENHGVGGENTVEGLSRIDSVLAGGGDVLLLMEGTNDISAGFSTETIRSNLSRMTDKATARGIDTVLASTIRRMNQPNHGPTNSLRDSIASLASNKDRDFVDPWGPLCPVQLCFDIHYWSFDLEIGHIDASGYDIMTDLFEGTILADSILNAPGTVAPSGEIADDSPTYEWDDLAGANWYQLQVDGPGGRVVDVMVDATTECSGGTCSETPNGTFADGEYEWRVRARNLIGYGAWSGWNPFQISVVLPGPVSLIAPSGDFYSETPPRFTFEWNETSDADRYELEVNDDFGGTPLQRIYLDTLCDAGGLCSVFPPETFDAGSYTWRVRGRNNAGNGLWSQSLPFVVYTEPPAAPPPMSPDGDTFADDPTFLWADAAGATGFSFRVNREDNELLANETVDLSACSGGVCSAVAGLSLEPGSYKWRVRSTSPLGPGAWSDFSDFDVLPCEAPQNRTVDAQVISGVESFAACNRLTVADGVRVTSGGFAEFHAGLILVLENGVRIEAGGRATIRVDP